MREKWREGGREGERERERQLGNTGTPLAALCNDCSPDDKVLPS